MERDYKGVTMAKPKYCTQNDGDCLICSLTNYGRDCNNKLIVGFRYEK